MKIYQIFAFTDNDNGVYDPELLKTYDNLESAKEFLIQHNLVGKGDWEPDGTTPQFNCNKRNKVLYQVILNGDGDGDDEDYDEDYDDNIIINVVEVEISKKDDFKFEKSSNFYGFFDKKV